MIRSTLVRGALALCGVIAFGGDSLAQGTALSPTDQVAAVLDKTASVLQQPFECDFAMNVGAEDGSARGSGHVAYFSPRMFAGEFKLNFQAPGQPASGGSIKVVADDSFVFVELESPDMPGTQAFKVSLEMFDDLKSKLEAMGGTASMQTSSDGSFADMLTALNFQKQTLKNGTTRLKANLDDLIPQELPFSLDLSLDLDSRTAFPKRLQMNGGDEFSVMFLTNKVQFPKKLDEGRFQYRAPRGVVVMDLTPMLEMQLDMMGAGFEEDDF